MPRKTIVVEELKTRVNQLLRTNIPESSKATVCMLIEQVLMDTGNYHGYYYTYWLDKGADEWFDLPEQTRQYMDGTTKKNPYLFGSGTEYDRVYY